MSAQARTTGSSTRRSVLLQLLATAARLDRTQSDPVVAARNALGVGLPLAIGALAGNASLGLASTIGALQTAFADRPGPYRLRMLRMSGTALAAAVTSTIAVLLSANAVASACLLLVSAFVAGLLLSIGQSAAQVGVAATAAALILGHQAERPGVALHVGLLVLAGGVGQTLLAIAAWPLARHRPERLALAGLYRDLAAMARRPPRTDVGPPLGDSLASVRTTLYGLGHDHGPSVEAYRVLLDEAERIRRELLVLGGYADRLASDDRPGAEAVRSMSIAASELLDEIAAALAQARPVDVSVLEPVRVRAGEVLAALDDPAISVNVSTRRAAAARVRSLTGQLRAAVETTFAGATEGARGVGQRDVNRAARLSEPMAIIRANLTVDSAVLRHAVRLAALVSASDFIVRTVGVGRGYWIPLTILVVLRPDFGSTFQRSMMRVAGTIVGLLLSTALVHWVPGGQWYSIALVAVFFFGMRFAGPGNLGLSAVSLAGVVVVLLSLAGIAPHTTVVARAVDTAIGGALALLAALLWPVWERRFVGARLGDLLDAYRVYTQAVADLAWSPERLQKARAASRRARTNAQASLARARSEPVDGQVQVDLGEAVLAHTHRFVHAMLTIESLRVALRETGGLVELDELLSTCIYVLQRCERAVRMGASPGPAPRLRQVQVRLADRLERDPQSAGGVETAAALVEASDRVANSLDTLVSELRRQLGRSETGAGLASRL